MAQSKRDEFEMPELGDLAELAGEPNWRLEAEIEVSKGPWSLMEVQLVADFDLERVTEGRQIVSGDEAASEIAGPHGIAVIRELNLLDCQPPDAARQRLAGL